MRPPTSPAGIVSPFYTLARGERSEPISLAIARSLLRRQGEKALIVTGLVEEGRFPQGEVDGPIGSLALARTLAGLGSEVTIVIDPEAVGPVEKLVDAAGLDGVTLMESRFSSAAEAREFAAQFGVVAAIEKLGQNSVGGRHLIWGTPVTAGDLFADDYLRAATDNGALTLAVGDNGNEIGFGNIAAESEALTPRGVSVEGGFFASTTVDHLLPASVSNLGCYVITGAVAILARRANLAVTGDLVREWTELGLRAGLRSGGVDDPAFQGDDGIPLRFVAAHAELISGIVHQSLLGDPWVADQ
ncbi:glutamate cyclase domain-containing protein [Saccharopolyspora spinosa]|nr:glutamate cyclase domain-containing protein [Saccharopolyspora spinosa]